MMPRTEAFGIREASAAELPAGTAGRVLGGGRLPVAGLGGTSRGAAGARGSIVFIEDGFGALSSSDAVARAGARLRAAGPIPADDDPAVTAARLAAVADWCRGTGSTSSPPTRRSRPRPGYPGAPRGPRLPADRGDPAVAAPDGVPLGDGADEPPCSAASRSRPASGSGRRARRGGSSAHDVRRRGPGAGLRAPSAGGRRAATLPRALLRPAPRDRGPAGLRVRPPAAFVPWWIDAATPACSSTSRHGPRDEPLAGPSSTVTAGVSPTVHSGDRAERSAIRARSTCSAGARSSWRRRGVRRDGPRRRRRRRRPPPPRGARRCTASAIQASPSGRTGSS